MDISNIPAIPGLIIAGVLILAWVIVAYVSYKKDKS